MNRQADLSVSGSCDKSYDWQNVRYLRLAEVQVRLVDWERPLAKYFGASICSA